jgi:hypothetical protein
MRKAALALSLIFAAGAGGLFLAGLGLGLAFGAVAGLCVVAGVIIFFGVGTDDLALSAVGLLVLTVTWNGIRVAGGAFGDVFLALAFAAVVAYVVAEKRPVPLPPWLLLAGIGFFLAGLLSMVFPPGTSVVQRSVVTQLTIRQQTGSVGLAVAPSDLGTLIKYELSFGLIPLLIAAVGTTPRRCLRLVNLWTAGAVVNACVGVADYVGIAHVTPVPISAGRSAGLTVQANYLALTCVIAIPTAMLWFGRSRRWTWAGLFGVPALLGGVYASGSRAGTVAALGAVAATVVVVPRLRPRLAVVLPVAGMALVLVLMFTNVGHKILNQVRLGSSNSTSGSDYQRSLQATAAWDQIQARPLQGVGFSVIANAHDIYLELLDAGGVIALAAFAVFCGGVAAAARRAVLGTQREEALALAVAMLVWLANGVFDNQLADKYLYVVPGLLLALSRTVMLSTAATAHRSPAIDRSRVAVGVAAPPAAAVATLA